MLPNSENLKKNPIVPLEVNITPISRKTLSSFSLSILTILLSYMTITRTVTPTGINVPVG